MPTVLRERGFEFRIYTSDHAPAHVHVFRAEAEIVIHLNPLDVREASGATSRDISIALEIAARHQAWLIAKWEEIHGK